jgi:hypothetical protein
MADTKLFEILTLPENGALSFSRGRASSRCGPSENPEAAQQHQDSGHRDGLVDPVFKLAGALALIGSRFCGGKSAWRGVYHSEPAFLSLAAEVADYQLDRSSRLNLCLPGAVGDDAGLKVIRSKKDCDAALPPGQEQNSTHFHKLLIRPGISASCFPTLTAQNAVRMGHPSSISFGPDQ